MNRKILAFGEYGVLNGGENSFLTIAAPLIHRGWQLTAAVPTDSDFEKALAKLDVPNIGLSLLSDGERKSQEAIRQECEQIIEQTQPDVVLCNSLSTSRLVGPVAKAKCIPSIGYLRDIIKLSKQAVTDINCLDRIIAVSHATRDWHVNQGVKPNKTIVIYNSVDLDRFQTGLSVNYLDSEFRLDSTSLVLLFVGQIGMRKGIDTLIETFRQVHEHLPQSQLLIVGQRNSQKQEAIEYEQAARKSAAQIGSGSTCVHWLGRRDDIPFLMNRADVLVHPANQEPLGRVLLESAACGLPVVTTNIGGSPEILKGLESFDLMVPTKSPSLMAESVISILTDPAKRQDISQRLLKIAQTRFAVDRNATQVHESLLDLMNRR